MAETKKTTKKTEAKEVVKKEPKKEVKSNVSKWEKLTITELKKELSELTLNIKVGKEENTAQRKALRKLIARKLTLENKSK